MQPFTNFIGTLIPTSFSLSMLYTNLSPLTGSLITSAVAYSLSYFLWKAKIRVKGYLRYKKHQAESARLKAYYEEFCPETYEAYYGEKNRESREAVAKHFITFDEDSWS